MRQVALSILLALLGAPQAVAGPEGRALDRKMAAVTPMPPGISEKTRAALDTTLEQLRARAGIPGLAVGIVEGGVPAYARGFGVRDLSTGAPVTADTRFYVASISKTFTATAVMQLVEQGKLALADPVERYLPAFEDSGISVEQLLTHTAGLGDWIRPSGATRDLQVTEYVRSVARHSPAYLPGKGWAYSDASFNVLGALIESVTGQSFPRYLESHVFQAAGLVRTTAAAPDLASDTAWPHRGEKTAQRASKHPWDRAFVPSSGIQSSIHDLTRWAAINLRREPALLSPASYAALFDWKVDTEWPGVAMGLGWQLEKRGNQWLPRHPGSDSGFRSLLTLYPAQQRAIVILSNGETTPRWEIRGAIEAILEGSETATAPGGFLRGSSRSHVVMSVRSRTEPPVMCWHPFSMKDPRTPERGEYLIDGFRVSFLHQAEWHCACREFSFADTCRHAREAAGMREAQAIIRHRMRPRLGWLR